MVQRTKCGLWNHDSEFRSPGAMYKSHHGGAACNPSTEGQKWGLACRKPNTEQSRFTRDGPHRPPEWLFSITQLQPLVQSTLSPRHPQIGRV